MVKKIVGRILAVYALLFAIGCIALYFFGDKVVLHPLTLPKQHVFKFDIPFRETNLKIDEKQIYNLIQFHPTNDAVVKGVVLYFHGNEKNVERYAPYAKLFTDNNWEVWMIDYPGFGKSTGKMTENELYEMSEQLYKMARARFEQQQIIIYGKSFGTGIASYLASVRDNRHLILETPYNSFKTLINDYLKVFPIGFASRYNFPINEYLKKVDDPITIFHGTKDEVIPYRNAAKLKKHLKPKDDFITLQNGKHNHLTDLDEMSDKLKFLLR
jgi:pimeloyl-ACP methyl ester carboxylesterase